MRLLVRLLVWLVLLASSPSLVWAQEGILINGSRVITGTLNAATTTGTATAYVLTLSPAIGAYVSNQCFTFKAHVANTGAATLNVNGIGALALVKFVGATATALAVGDIGTGQVLNTCYDGTQFQLVSTSAASGAPTNALYLTATANGTLSAEVNLGALTTGMLKHTVSGGISAPATAIAGTDYVAPSTTLTAGFGMQTIGDLSTGRTIAHVAPAADDQIYISDSTSAGTWRSIPNCPSTGAQALTYATATNAFTCGAITGGGGGAPVGTSYWTSTADATLTSETNLGLLTTGLLKHTVAGAVSTPATAIAGTDYVIPSGTVATAAALAANPANCPIAGTFPNGIDAAGVPENCVVLGGINPQTTTYQVLAADFDGYKTITVASGTFTITLVASGTQPAAGKHIRILNYGAGVVTIARSGQNINGGVASLVLPASSALAPVTATIQSDGTNYYGSISGVGGGNPTMAQLPIQVRFSSGIALQAAFGGM